MVTWKDPTRHDQGVFAINWNKRAVIMPEGLCHTVATFIITRPAPAPIDVEDLNRVPFAIALKIPGIVEFTLGTQSPWRHRSCVTISTMVQDRERGQEFQSFPGSLSLFAYKGMECITENMEQIEKDS